MRLLLGACLLIPVILTPGCAAPEKRQEPATQPAADPLAAARAAYLARDYQRALSLLRPLAEQNIPEAQYALGYMYYFGQGMPRNREAADYWVERAAARGYAKAEIALRQLGARRAPQPGSAETAPGEDTTAAKDDVQERTTVNHAPPTEPTPPTEPVPPAATSPAARQDAAPAAKPGPKEPTVKPAVIPAAAAKVPGPAPRQQAGDEVHGDDWLRSRDPSHFTIQLVASARKKAILDYIKQNDIRDKAAYFQDQGHEQPWYCIVYDDFPDFQKAQQALTGLHKKLHGASPWIRRFSSIQKAMETPAAAR